MKRLIFENWKEWRGYCGNAVTHFVKGVARIVVAILFGLVSLLYAAYLSVKSFVKSNPVISLSFLCAILTIVLILTYVSMAVKIKGVECQRDSISFELMKYQETYETDTLVGVPFSFRITNHWNTDAK